MKHWLSLFLFAIILVACGSPATVTNTPFPPTEVPTKAPTPVSLTPSSAKKPQITPLPEFQGKIIELNIDVPNFDDIGFSFKLEWGSDKKKNHVVYFFDKDKINTMKVTNSAGKTISHKDLKVGQNIKIIRIDDFGTKLYKGFEIVVLN